ncbi:MAG TPA: hypothetical protein VG961_08735 [Ignavibacteria bacterium]|nr:hypothetical protein [Ignavibacteria bacterium]
MLKYLAAVIYILAPFIFVFSQEPDIKDPCSAIWLYTESELNSKYIFRGIVLEDNYVYQPAVYAGYDGLDKAGTISAGVWLNFSMPRRQSLLNEESGGYEKLRQPFRYNETDLYLMHEINVKKLSVKNTFAVYLFTEETGYPNTTEYILNLSYPAGRFSLLSEFACDISAYPGAYVFTHGIGWDTELTEDLNFSSVVNLIWGGAKYNGVNSGTEKALLNCAGGDFSLTYSHNSGLYAKLRCQYYRMLEDEIVQSNGYDTWCFGLLAGFNF